MRDLLVLACICLAGALLASGVILHLVGAGASGTAFAGLALAFVVASTLLRKW